MLGAFLGMAITIVLVEIYNIVNTSSAISYSIESLLSTTIGSIFGVSFIQAIQIPSIYKWGAERGRIQMFIIIVIIAVVGVLLGSLLKGVDVSTLTKIFNQYGLILIIIATILMYVISYKISLKIYKNKEY